MDSLSLILYFHIRIKLAQDAHQIILYYRVSGRTEAPKASPDNSLRMQVSYTGIHFTYPSDLN